MRARTWLLASVLVGCGSAPGAPHATTVAQVDVTPPRAPPETKFRGDVKLDVALASYYLDSDNDHFAEASREATKQLVPCLKHEAPRALDVWIVGRVNEQGHVEDAKAAADVPSALAPCLVAGLANVELKGSLPFAASFLLHAEPAPPQCKGDACVFIHPPENAKPPPAEDADGSDESEHAEFGVIGLLNTGDDAQGNVLGGIGDSFGAGGLGLSGTGPGGGGRGEGIGLGSIGTLGHGAGFSAGYGRLGGEHHALPPSIHTGGISVTGRLPPEVIQRIVRQNLGRFRLCYDNGLRKDPKLEGSVNTTFVIARDGAVAKVTDAKSGMPNKDVVQCIEKGFAQLSFPQPEGGTVSVTFPMTFSPGKEAPPPPVFTVGGVHFPALTPEVVEKKLASGWRTMVIAAPPEQKQFVIFAMKAGASAGPVSTALWNHESAMVFLPHKDSEGFHLTFDGVDAAALEGDLVDPPSAP